MIKFLVEEIDQNARLKKNIIKSQLAWIKERDLNYIVTSINCGGSGYIACENESLINDTLDRIKKLQSFYYIDDN